MYHTHNFILTIMEKTFALDLIQMDIVTDPLMGQSGHLVIMYQTGSIRQLDSRITFLPICIWLLMDLVPSMLTMKIIRLLTFMMENLVALILKRELTDRQKLILILIIPKLFI